MADVDKITIVEDALEKAHHVLASMPVRYELDALEAMDMVERKRQAQWLFTQKEALSIDISIAMDYIEKSIDGVCACREVGDFDE